MLRVKTSKEAEALLEARFKGHTAGEEVPLADALGRTLFTDVSSREFVPDFDRSTVDGYAVHARDTFGCSESIPAILRLAGEVLMGRQADICLAPGSCVYVPTGGQLPPGADAMVMLEYAEDFGDGTIGIQRSVAPGTHMIFRGDDVKSGTLVYRRGHRIMPKDVGTLAAMGYGHVSVFCRPKVAVISTGDEIVPPETVSPDIGWIRDVNGPMLASAVAASGGQPVPFGIVPDEPRAIKSALEEAAYRCDMTLISGGSSVGVKDAAADILSELGEVLFHGLAIKPGKPSLAADVCGRPVFGLPGHPVAAYFIYSIFARPLIYKMMDSTPADRSVMARCASAISSNHGREECVPVRLENGSALPIIVKSGLITTLSGADGFIRIPRDTEGIAQGEQVKVFLFSEVI